MVTGGGAKRAFLILPQRIGKKSLVLGATKRIDTFLEFGFLN